MPTSVRAPARVLAAVGATVVAWASAFVAIRHVGADVRPGELAAGRLLVGTAVLGLAQVRRRWIAPQRRDWGLIALYGVAWFGIYNVTLNAAERHLDAGTAAMLVNIGPILIAGLAARLLGERLPRRLGVGGAVAFGGAVLIGLAARQAAHADTIGVVLCLLAAASYAVGVVSQKVVLQRLPALQVTFLGCTIGALAALPFVPGLIVDLGSAPSDAAGWIVYLGVVPTAIAFTLWSYALSQLPAARLGVTTYLVPPLAALGSWALLGEAPAGLAWLGGALCLAGVALSRRHAS